ncbi:nucleic acid binding [Ascochyta rabiei]|uniref:Nucleic acid binding n=1 Tax=Didymella rabiei TaxID=5454 RepID=A0A162ZC22_DIDRA|nr:nucleic acid binding [Ascochyta rabiei]
MSISTSLGDSLPEETNSASWPVLFPLTDSIVTEDQGLFSDYLPHDMRWANDMTLNYGFPFAWMTQPFESPSRGPHILGQGISDLSMLHNDNLAALQTCEPLTGTTGGPTDRGESRTCESLEATLIPTADVCPSFPMLQEEELHSTSAELFGYVNQIPETAYTALRKFYISKHGFDDMSFPHSRLLHSFVELCFEYFDPHLPFLHPMRVQTEDLSWTLLTAVAAIGSQYSDVRDASKFTIVLQYILSKALPTTNLQTIAKKSETSLVQSVLLRDVGLMFSGSILDQTVLQQEKNVLITLCRGLATLIEFPDTEEYMGDQELDDRWLAWLQKEEVVRNGVPSAGIL